MSTHSEEGVSDVRKAACEALLEQRAQVKLKGPRMNDIANRMHLAMPVPRDHVQRLPTSPPGLGSHKKDIALQRLTAWQEQQALYEEFDDDYEGVDNKERYIMEKEDWKHDVIPEIYEGKNIFDFWSPDITEKLEQLEREELIRLRELEAEMSQMNDGMFELTEEQKEKLAKIKKKKAQIMLESKRKKGMHGVGVQMGRDSQAYGHKTERTVEAFKKHLDDMGFDSTLAVEGARARSVSVNRTPSRSVSRSQSRQGRKRTRGEYERSQTPKPGEGFRNLSEKLRAQSIGRNQTKKLRQDGRLGESDRHVYDWKPKHLYSGKMGFSRDRR